MDIDVVAAVISRAGRVVGIRKLSDFNIIPIRIGAVPELDAIDQTSLHVSARRLEEASFAITSDRTSLLDRKSTRLNSSPRQYLVCRLLLEKKKNNVNRQHALRIEDTAL